VRDGEGREGNGKRKQETKEGLKGLIIHSRERERKREKLLMLTLMGQFDEGGWREREREMQREKERRKERNITTRRRREVLFSSAESPFFLFLLYCFLN